jgi:DNA-binding GntR family transcriptional regulator
MYTFSPSTHDVRAMDRIAPDLGTLRTRARAIALALEQDIGEGRIAPGQRLEEGALAQRFGVSRTPVREALRGLAGLGLVTIGTNGRAEVASLSASALLDMFEATAEIEASLARLAARRLDPAGRDALLAAHRAAIAAPDVEAFWTANGRFHDAIAAAAQNTVLAQTLDQLDRRIAAYRRLITWRPGRMQRSLREHEAIVDALLAHDADGAAAAMREHLRLLGDEAMALVRAVEGRAA